MFNSMFVRLFENRQDIEDCAYEIEHMSALIIMFGSESLNFNPQHLCPSAEICHNSFNYKCHHLYYT